MLWKTQRPDGSWDAMGDMGASPTAQVVVALHYLRQLDPRDAKGAAKWLRSQQRRDGSWVLYPFAREGDVGATASVWAALHVTGDPENAQAIARARQRLDARGGIDRIIEGLDAGDMSAVFLALAGLLDPKRLPVPPAAWALVPPVMHFLQTRFHSGVLMGALQLNVLARRLRGDFGPNGEKIGLIAKAECRGTISLLQTFQNFDGSWNANTIQTALALPALHAAGLPLTDERIERGVTWLKSQRIEDGAGVRFHAFSSAVWSTAFDVRALLAGGVPASDPRIEKALAFLVDSQLDIPQPEVDNRHEGVPRTGGWAFQKTNHTMADCDDAGVVLTALGQALAMTGDRAMNPELEKRVRRAVSRGREWLFGMQNPDGGWSAFVWNLPPKKPGPAMTKTVRAKLDSPLSMARFLVDPEPALGDPSTEDVTGRVLHGLGSLGLTWRAPEVSRAIDFLKAQQCDHGGWWGRWVVNDLAATAFVLMGLRAVGYDMNQPWVQKAVRWTLSKQNPDGGFGETVDSYRDPSLAGIGPSMAPLTGLVIQGLIAAGEESEPVQRAVDYLLRRQRADGTWPNDDYLHANVPPDTYYLYPEAPKFYCAEALARHAEARKHPGPETPSDRWNDKKLDAARQRGDPLGDRVVSAIFARGDTAAVNALLGQLFRSDDPIPEGMPEEARRYFEETEALPPWADRQQIALAQKLFSRAGWEVAISLFCSSLPQAYAAAKGSQVLTQTGAMVNRLRQRIFETAQFIFDVLDEGGLGPSGRGIRATQKIRLMHAAVRHLLLTRTSPAWDSKELGLPINQEDLAGTLLTFSAITLDGMRQLGVEVSPEESAAWIHLWNVVGTFLGIDEELMARDEDDADVLMDAIRIRQWKPSEDGRILARALVDLLQEFMPGELLDGMPIAMIRYLSGDLCSDILGLPHTDWTKLLNGVKELAEPLAPIAELAGAGERELGIAQLFAKMRQQIMYAVVNIEREGKQAPFRIPKSLEHTIEDQ
ncbi:MAG: DUF2236 domain-containing protein [Myxococcaceae bacterium]|nr:DUF2236 domain-containing protein [Myxococcaceae bacterium]